MVTFHFDEPSLTLTCVFQGHLDTQKSMELSSMMETKTDELKHVYGELSAHGLRICFDMKEVTFISSGFIRLSISTAKQVASGHFRMVNCDPMVKKTLKIAGLDETLDVF